MKHKMIFFFNGKSQSQASGDICKAEAGLGNLNKLTLASTMLSLKKKKNLQSQYDPADPAVQADFSPCFHLSADT